MLLLILSLNISLPVFAQGLGDLASPLEDIKGKLKGEGITVIDYSARDGWGRLPEGIVEKLENNNYNSLEDIAEQTYEDLIDIGLSPDEANEIMSEIQARKYAGEYQLHSIVGAVARVMRNLIGGLAVIWIIISGVSMVMAGGDETKITEQKNSITYAVVGLVAILLIERLIAVLYGYPAEYRTALITGDARFSNEVYGVVGFIKAVIGAVAVFMIIIAGARTIFAQGEEEQLTKQKKSLIWVGVGLILILVNKVIIENIFIIPANVQGDQIKSGNVNAIIVKLGQATQFFLAFVGVIALGVLIYGAGSMIANYGNEEMVTRGKKIIKNSIIGIVIILSAYAIVATMIGFK